MSEEYTRAVKLLEKGIRCKCNNPETTCYTLISENLTVDICNYCDKPVGEPYTVIW